MNKAAYIPVFLLCIMSLAGCGKRTTQSSDSNWSPPSNPKPKEILSEARADAKSGNYSSALAKHVWFHENALKHESALAGVRLSFALTDWINLATAYPPALEKLKTVREEAETNVRNRSGHEAYEAFMDFDAINEALNEIDKTKELFVWLDSHQPEKAKEVFDLAKPSLVKAKNYSLCGKYLDPEASFAAALQSYRMMSGIAKNRSHGKKLQDFSDKTFINSTTTLIALLVLNDRNVEAQNIAEKISKQSDIPQFQAEIQKALNGEIPTPWP